MREAVHESVSARKERCFIPIISSSTMRSNLILVFVIGLANAAISNKLPNKDWDDEDSMILPSTTSKGFSSFSRVPSEEKPAPVVLDDRTRYISLIPTSEQHDDNSQEPIKETPTPEEFFPQSLRSAQENKEVKPEEPTTQEDSGYDSDSTSSEYTTEGSKIRIVQLGKIPLTYEIIPLMSNYENSYEKSPMKPVSFFPEQSGDMMIAKAKVLRREQQQQQRGETEEDAPQAQTTKDVHPPEPLTYLTPPRQDGEDYWRQYPLLSPEHDSEATSFTDNQNHEASNSESDYQLPITTLNPILERLNAFLQKAKRHSEEHQFQQDEILPSEEKREEHIKSTGETREISSPTQDAEETTNASQLSTDGSTENTEEQSSTLTTDSTPLPTLSTALLPPKLGIPESEPFFRSRIQQQSPYWTNGPVSPSVDQYFSDYVQSSLPINKYYYSNPELQIQTSMKPPSRSLYSYSSIPSMDSYLPRRFLPFEKAASSDNIDYPFIRYNDYYRPSRSNLIARPTSLVNSINDEDSYLGTLGYSNELGYAYGNPSYNLGSTPFNSYHPRSYSRPIVPYRPYYSSLSSNLDNNLMYAPLYSYQQYRQLQPQQQFI